MGEQPRSLTMLLTMPKVKDAFMRYLELHAAAENLLFYEAVEMYREIPEDDVKQLREQGRGIILLFIVPKSRLEINISSILRDQLAVTTKFTASTFDDLQWEIKDLLERGHLENFNQIHYHGRSEPSRMKDFKHEEQDGYYEDCRKTLKELFRSKKALKGDSVPKKPTGAVVARRKGNEFTDTTGCTEGQVNRSPGYANTSFYEKFL